MVTRPAPEDGTGKPEDAQLGDFEAAWSWLEAAERDGEAAVHWRSEKTPQHTYEGTPRYANLFLFNFFEFYAFKIVNFKNWTVLFFWWTNESEVEEQ